MNLKLLLALTFFSALFISSLSAHQPKSYALASSMAQHKKFHMTLVHVTTSDLTIVNKVEKLISKFITKNYPIKNQHCSLKWNFEVHKREMWGPNSLKMGGEAEKFKQELHAYLVANKKIGKYIDQYRPAHINVKGDNMAILYKKVRVDDFYLMPVY